MKKKSTIALRVDKDFVDFVRESTGESVASKAFILSAARYIEQVGVIARMEAEQLRLADEQLRLAQLLRQKKVLFQSLVPLCAKVAELAGQDDLFE